MSDITNKFPSERELVLKRTLDAPRNNIYRCWTEGALMTRWFTPAPWTTPRADVDARPGGSSYILMRGPDGEEHHNYGVFLELVPDEKIVITDAFTSAWTPAEKAFLTTIITLEDTGDGKTEYTAVARHWSVADTKAHENMGFHEGWDKATDQLEALAKTL